MTPHPPAQNMDELNAFIALLQEEGVRSYLEIGARHGGTFHAVMSALPVGSKGVAVDLPGAAWGGNSSTSLTQISEELLAQGYKTSVIFGDSHLPATREAVVTRNPYDAVFIDADHRLDAVTADWRDYGPMGRIVAFHDIAGVGKMQARSGLPVEVPLLWQALKERHHHREIVARDSRMGIGVLWQ